jgi:hypothetical protein
MPPEVLSVECPDLTNSQKSSISGFTNPDNPCRNTCNDRPGRYIPRYHGPCSDNSPFTDTHTGENDGIGTDPDIPPDINSLRITALITYWKPSFEAMLIGNNPHTRPDQSAITYFDTAGAIYHAKIVDLDAIADPDTSATLDIGITIDGYMTTQLDTATTRGID